MKNLTCLILIMSFWPSCQKTMLKDDIHFNFLGFALSEYTKTHGKMPSNITDKDGKPLLSWRVELLNGFLGDDESKLYKQFKLDEPWNSPHNLKVAQTIPFLYVDPIGARCEPVDSTPNSVLWTMDPKKPNYTPYLGVTGPTAAFRPGESRGTNTVSDPAAIVVVDKSDVLWTEPRDISLEKIKNGNVLRWYGNTMLYLTTKGHSCKWNKDQAIDGLNEPPNYEFESDK